jgi:hypothetical protein
MGSKKDLVVILLTNHKDSRLGKIKRFDGDRGKIVIGLQDEKEIEINYQGWEKACKVFYRDYTKKEIYYLKSFLQTHKPEEFEEPKMGPRALAQAYREVGEQISGFVDEYVKIFGERPKKLG